MEATTDTSQPHSQRACDALEQSRRMRPADALEYSAVLAAEAQAHATLAVGEQLVRTNRLLAGIAEQLATLADAGMVIAVHIDSGAADVELDDATSDEDDTTDRDVDGDAWEQARDEQVHG